MVLSLTSVYPKMSGGYLVNERNQNFLKYVYSEENIIFYSLGELNLRKELISNLKSIFFNNQTKYKAIVDEINEGNIKEIFVSNSLYGDLIKYLKVSFPHIKIYVFYHNIEYSYYKQLFAKSYNFKNRLLCSYVKIIENKSTKYSHIRIALNDRDSKQMENLYGYKANFIFPTTLDPIINSNKEFNFNNTLKLLFVGSNFFANINGIKWFLNNVFPYLTGVELTIVGKNIKSNLIGFENENISILENVVSLNQYYYDSNVVILPIFEGSGMKTKTAEALKFSMPILATKEALEGFENLHVDELGYECNNASDFINCINIIINNPIILNQFSNNSKKYFDNYLNSEVVYQKYKEVFLKLVNSL
jgi:glycosyltransferase involved in cell wall biosynthesis